MTQHQQQIVAAARRWIGTPFQHQGRLKATGVSQGRCDCLGLLVAVAQELGLKTCRGTPKFLASLDERDYGHIPDGKRLQTVLDEVLNTVPNAEMQPGDVLLLRFDGAPQHLGIASDYHGGGLGIIHALASARKVVEHTLDPTWYQRIIKTYRL